MTSKITLKYLRGGSPIVADIALAPVNNRGTVGKLNGMVMKAYEYSVSKMPLPTEFQKGYAEIHPVKGNERSIIFVVTMDGKKTNETLSTNLTKALIESDVLLNDKRIWLPLMGTGAGGLSFKESHNLTIAAIQDAYEHLNGNYEFLIAFPEEEEAIALLDTLKNEPGFAVPGMSKEKASSDFLLPDTINDNIYALGSTWGKKDKTIDFLRDGIWQNGYEDRYLDNVKSIKEGSLVILKSTVLRSTPPALRVKAIGVVTKNHNDGTTLNVEWGIITGNVDVPGPLSSKSKTYQPLVLEDLLLILKHVKPKGKETDKLIERHLSIIGQTVYQKNSSTIPGIHPDSIYGPDLLDISNDVEAFAKLVAADTLVPPLAIALFGKWGGGKSFFMEKLKERIDELSKSSLEDYDGNKFYKSGILHIHFNAWSYLDANLWANIVTTIFEGIQAYITGEHVKDEFRKEVRDNLTEKLLLTKEERHDLSRVRKKAFEQIKKLEGGKEQVTTDLNTKIEDIKKASLFNVIKTTAEQFKVKDRIKEALDKDTDVKQTWDQFKKIVPESYLTDPAKAYEEIKSFRFFLREFFRPTSVKFTLLFLFLFLVLILLVPVIWHDELSAVTNIDFGWMQRLSSLLMLAGPAVLRLRKLNEQLRPVLGAIWQVKTSYDQELAEAKADHDQQVLALQQEIQQHKEQIESLEQNITHKNEEIREINYKLEHALSSESLRLFIKNRLTSQDYQKHLGLVAMIRKDFHTLSELFVGQNKELESEKFRASFEQPLERIVLYIDDLDRCPEERVIEVLEAVNLLMAYPLFVVVVGVDPRWVKNALHRQFHTQFAGSHNDKGKYEAIAASDYLEKIFQIPFHLKEASDEGVKSLLNYLTGHYLGPALQDLDDKEEHSGNILLDSLLLTSLTSIKETEDDDEETLRPETPVKQEVYRLELTQSEAEMMQDLSGVLGNNPRAVKRFVNAYMLIKAHSDLVYIRDEAENDFLLIMFMLALYIGPYKGLLPHFREFIYRERERTGATLYTFLDQATKVKNESGEIDHDLMNLKQEMHVYLSDVGTHLRLNGIIMEAYTRYEAFVKRFTFSELT